MRRLLLSLVALAGCTPTQWSLTASGDTQRGDGVLNVGGQAIPIHCERALTPPDPTSRRADEAIIRTADTVVFWGDSITNPYAWFTFFLHGVYGLFDPYGQTRPNFLNVGINGARYDTYNTDNYRAHFVDPYTDSKLAIVFLGVNYVLQADMPSLEVIKADARAFFIYARSRNPSLQFLVMGPWVIGATRPDGSNPHDADLDAVNEAIREVCREMGLAFIDLRRAWFEDDQGDPLYHGDGLEVHPNGVGAGWLSSQALQHIQVRF
jgi:lysophospholipase L1-like esterase